MPYTSDLAEALAPDLLERFLRYVRIDTQSQRDRTQSPSTPGQLELARMLVQELKAAGLADAALDGNGYVTATLPGEGPVVGLIAHVDTSPDAPGANVQPLVHNDYDGEPLALPRGGTVVEAPHAKGHDIVTASGDTLLGADDKAGVAEIMAAVAYLAAHPERPHPTLRVCFTPDEEIGEGATLFDVERFGVARELYEARGFDVDDVSADHPWDLTATDAAGREVHVEVKGTTGAGAAVIVTAGERHHLEEAPRLGAVPALVIISMIKVSRAAQPEATGGTVSVHAEPWTVDAGRWTETVWRYEHGW